MFLFIPEIQNTYTAYRRRDQTVAGKTYEVLRQEAAF
jgi:hypothetical protein